MSSATMQKRNHFSNNMQKLLNVATKRSLMDPQTTEFVVHKRSKIEPAQNNEIAFQCCTTMEDNTQTKIGEIGSLAEEAIINVKERLVFQRNNVENVTERA